jgi:hypothetical protein
LRGRASCRGSAERERAGAGLAQQAGEGGGAVRRSGDHRPDGRLIADELTKTFKQQFYVENRVGGGGVVAAVQVARADPDGYTLMIGSYGPHIFAPATSTLSYDVLTDFTHIAMIGGESFIIVAHPALGVKSFAELVQFAKSHSGPAQYGLARPSDPRRLVVEQLIRKPGLLPNLNHIPYRGGGPVMTDLIGNHVSLGCITLSAAIEHVRSGTLVPLALIATERAPGVAGASDHRRAWPSRHRRRDLVMARGTEEPAGADGRAAQSGGPAVAARAGDPAAIRAGPVPVDGCRRADAQRLHRRRAQALDHVLPDVGHQDAVSGCGTRQARFSCLR